MVFISLSNLTRAVVTLSKPIVAYWQNALVTKTLLYTSLPILASFSAIDNLFMTSEADEFFYHEILFIQQQ